MSNHERMTNDEARKNSEARSPKPQPRKRGTPTGYLKCARSFRVHWPEAQSAAVRLSSFDFVLRPRDFVSASRGLQCREQDHHFHRGFARRAGVTEYNQPPPYVGGYNTGLHEGEPLLF